MIAKAVLLAQFTDLIFMIMINYFIGE